MHQILLWILFPIYIHVANICKQHTAVILHSLAGEYTLFIIMVPQKNMSLRTQNVMFRGANRRFLELITIELQYYVQWPISKRLRVNTLKSSV